MDYSVNYETASSHCPLPVTQTLSYLAQTVPSDGLKHLPGSLSVCNASLPSKST